MRTRHGHTLLETVLSTTLLLAISGGVLAMMRDSGAAWSESLRAAKQQGETDDGLARLAHELEQANPATLAIDPSSSFGDELRFELPIDVQGGGVLFGAIVPLDGRATLQPGATIIWTTVSARGSNERQLVRRVVGANGATLVADEVVCDAIDLPDANGAKGFAVVRDGRTLAIALRRRPGAAPAGSSAPCRVASAIARMRSD